MNYEQKYLKYKQKYLQLKGGIMRCPFKPGDIVQVIGPFPLEGDVASTHLNLFGEVKGIKFFKLPKTDVEECIYIQIVIDKVQNEILKVRPNNLKRLYVSNILYSSNEPYVNNINFCSLNIQYNDLYYKQYDKMLKDGYNLIKN